MMKIPTFIRGLIAAVFAILAGGGGGVNTAFAQATILGVGATSPGGLLGTSLGRSATSSGVEGVAVGFDSDAGSRAVAVGPSAEAAGANAVAIGSGADATGANAIAIGGARTGGRQVVASDNEIRIGDDMHTQVDIGGVRLKGDGGGQQSVVTRLAGLETMLGMPTVTDPAPTGGVAFRTDIDSLRREFGEDVEMLSGGVAIGLALDAPYLQPGRQFAVRLGSGYFNGEAAIGLSATARYADSGKVFVDGGVGFADGEVGGGIGVTWQF